MSLKRICEALEMKVSISSGAMVEHPLDLMQLKVDSVASRLKLSTAMKRAKREPIGLRVCVDFAP
jgi:hypothetical protein